jgi:hypothetical protein
VAIHRASCESGASTFSPVGSISRSRVTIATAEHSRAVPPLTGTYYGF